MSSFLRRAGRAQFSAPSVRRTVACATLLLAAGVASMNAAVASLAWDEYPALPPAAGEVRQPGVASPYVGVHGAVLIVAGGANFPRAMPWDGGAKAWWDDIWVLEKDARGGARWHADPAWKLPRPIGYGISVGTPEGVVCVGGSDAERCYAEVFLLSWDAATRTLRRSPWPSLPEPLANMAGARVGQTLFVAGGQHVMKGAQPSSAFWSLDLSQRGNPAAFIWKKEATWPGPPRVLPVAAGQGAPGKERFFLFSGRQPRTGQATTLLRDAYAYDPRTRTWATLGPVGGGDGVSVMAGTAAPVGTDEILVFGGDHGDRFLELEAHDLAVERARARLATAEGPERARLERDIETQLAAKRAIYENHLGFGREVWAYDTTRDAWRVAGRSPVSPQVTTLAVNWDGEIVIPSGEIRPGVRTSSVVRVKAR